MYLKGEKITREFQKYLARCMKRRKLEPDGPESMAFVMPVSELLTVEYSCGGHIRPGGGLDHKEEHYLIVSLYCPEVSDWLGAHCPDQRAGRWPLADTTFPLMESSDRVLTWMTPKEINQKVRAELHPLLDTVLIQADTLVDHLRAITDVAALDALLRDGSREWRLGFEAEVAMAAIVRGPGAAIETARSEITALRQRGVIQRVLEPMEAWMQRLQAELH